MLQDPQWRVRTSRSDSWSPPLHPPTYLCSLSSFHTNWIKYLVSFSNFYLEKNPGVRQILKRTYFIYTPKTFGWSNQIIDRKVHCGIKYLAIWASSAYAHRFWAYDEIENPRSLQIDRAVWKYPGHYTSWSYHHILSLRLYQLCETCPNKIEWAWPPLCLRPEFLRRPGSSLTCHCPELPSSPVPASMPCPSAKERHADHKQRYQNSFWYSPFFLEIIMIFSF